MDWFPWYFQLYKADTMHLDPYQDGCYRRLIDHYMSTRQPLPDNDLALARICGDSHPNWEANGGAIARLFFKSKNGLLYHKKCDEILSDQDSRLKNLSESGKKGAEKRWNKIKELDSQPIATLKPTHSHPIATPMGYDSTGQDKTIQNKTIKKESKKESCSKSKKNQNLIENDFEEFWRTYPRKVGKAAAKAKYLIAIKKITHSEIIEKTMKFAQSVTEKETEFIPHPATWLHQERFFDEIPPKNPIGKTNGNHNKSLREVGNEFMAKYYPEETDEKPNEYLEGEFDCLL